MIRHRSVETQGQSGTRREVLRHGETLGAPSKVTGRAAPVGKCCNTAKSSTLPRGRGSVGGARFHAILRAEVPWNSIPVTVLLVAALAAGISFGWDGKIHPGIVRAALGVLPADDRIQERLGDEAPRLMQYVQLGDWVDTLVAQREAWDTGGQTLELHGPSFFADDFLLFPASPARVQHMLPDVKSTYRPFFLRALQALRTESPANAARWMGSLLHFVTDSGSPPHVIGVKGADHTKMESWLDTSRIDLRGYVPQFLGDSDEAAVQGLAARMEQLAAYSAIRANKMVPLVKANDRAAMEPLALECAAETARVSADVIHTLLKLVSAPRLSPADPGLRQCLLPRSRAWMVWRQNWWCWGRTIPRCRMRACRRFTAIAECSVCAACRRVSIAWRWSGWGRGRCIFPQFRSRPGRPCRRTGNFSPME